MAAPLVHVLALITFVAALAPGVILAQDEANRVTAVILHVTDDPTPCNVGFDCGVDPPTIDVTGFMSPVVHVVLRKFDAVTGIQCAFEWGDWVFTSSQWACLPGQTVQASPTAPGPDEGTLQTTFDLITGGALTPIGSLRFASEPLGGCLELVQSSEPGENLVVGANAEQMPINEGCWGRVCAGLGGLDVCEVVPVEAVTWARIKGNFAER